MHLHAWLLIAGGWVALITTLRIGIVRPLREALRRLEELLELPAALRELTAAFTDYMQNNERRLTRVEEGLSLVARTLRVRLNLTGDGEDEPTTPPA